MLPQYVPKSQYDSALLNLSSQILVLSSALELLGMLYCEGDADKAVDAISFCVLASQENLSKAVETANAKNKLEEIFQKSPDKEPS